MNDIKDKQYTLVPGNEGGEHVRGLVVEEMGYGGRGVDYLVRGRDYSVTAV
jgi:hypothetical protein